MGEARLGEVVGYLDTYLRLREIPDEGVALNGLQVENRGTVARVVAAVDGSLASIETAVGAGGPVLLLVHHGLFWDGNLPVAGRRYLKLRALLQHDAALYAAHIPLDVHPEVGNNAVLGRMLGLRNPMPFGAYKGIAIGLKGELGDEPLRDDLVRNLGALLNTTVRVIPGGPDRVSRVGVITGAGSSAIKEAAQAGLDTFITGEGAHHTYFDAMEFGVNVIYAGHYATEQVGVKALAEHLATRFQLPWEFQDHPTGM